MTRRAFRSLPALLAAVIGVAASLLSSPALACRQPPDLPACTTDSGVKVALGWKPGKGACSSGVLSVSLSICSDAGGTFGWTIGAPSPPAGAACSGLPGSPPAATCSRTTPEVTQVGTLDVDPGGCAVVTIPFNLRSCVPSPGAVSVTTQITDPAGGTCEVTTCQILTCLKPESGFPSITISAADSMAMAPAAGAAGFAWDIGYDGLEPSSGPHCLALVQVNGFGDELFPVTLRDEQGNVLSAASFEEAPPGTPRESQFASVDVPAGTSFRIFGECPFKGVCFPGLDNEFRLEARMQDPLTGDCLPIAASAADVRAIIEGFDPLRFESVEDLGGGRMAITWVLRGPLREVEFDVRLDGHLDVESATAASQPMPTMVPPPPPSLLATQPVVTFGGRGSHLVRLSLTSIPQRDLEDTYFEDNVVIRVIAVDPGGTAHRGNLDNGARVRYVTSDGIQTSQVAPIRL